MKIAATDILTGVKTRVKKDSTVYGIPLVATNDAQASPARIKDTDGTTKAFIEYL